LHILEERGLRPTWLEIDIKALRNNFHEIRKKTGPGLKLCPVVKANAYGMGAVGVAACLQDLGCDYLGVALVEEGLELRESGITMPVIMIGAAAGEESIRAAAANDIDISIHNFEALRSLSRVSSDLGRPIRTHLKIETGMGRLGVTPEETGRWCEEAGRSGVDLVGAFTTFSSSDQPDSPRTPRQLEELKKAVAEMRRFGFDPPLLHAANSGAILNFPETLLTMARPGLLLYGIAPAPDTDIGPMEPVASFRARVVQVSTFPSGHRFGYSGAFKASRDTRVAVLPAGYADGVNRLLGNRSEVLISGRRAPVIGRVSMDLVTVDVTDLPGVGVGDTATLIGADGGDEISAWDVAGLCGSIPWELFCWIGERVPRVFTDGERAVEISSRFLRETR
jgi:alanine racemase